ncbi:hypothetical protein [Paenibacillus naphthalenovorans]|uniref:Uncharacterized protein n=1 Tax=Paenibacillus naphthalenovorans TaxID=162209 RepID=A0A0U2WAY8_9BACL|nr:hypothetical protein [Paenibacillus naphthalenovorans]ALS24621.1 hypothetical protein IJ22_43350 [Paenibacillus naphthalenovorans]
MNNSYYCKKCRMDHEITSTIGVRHLHHNLTEKEIANFINIATTIPTYEVARYGIPNVFEGTDAFVREVKITQTLQEKFPNVDAFKTTDGLKEWLEEQLQGSNNAAANALSRIQGDAAGEVDFIREMQGNIRSIFTKTDFPRNADGRIVSNNPGIDAIEYNRLTGEIINEYQVKTLRSADSINETLKDFLNNDHYKPTTVLVGPQELIDRAHELGIPNPTKVMGTLQDNLDSANELSNKILNEQLAVGMTPGSVAGEMISGAAIGAVISVTVSGLVTYLQYKSGKMTFDEMKMKMAKDGLKGTITGGALASLSLFIPGGIIGAGVGFVVGVTLRRLLDEAYGDGMFGGVLETTRAVHANVKLLNNGTVYVAQLTEMNGYTLAKALSTVDDMIADRMQADNIYTKLERDNDNRMRIDYSQQADSILSRLDSMRNRLQGGR